MSIRNGAPPPASLQWWRTGGEEVVDGYAGIDWATDEHAVRVVGEGGERLFEGFFAHSERGLEELCRTLDGHGACRVAIERPDGVLVERVLEADVAVLAIHPNQLKAARSRFRASGGKSDSFDAFRPAELARADHHRFGAPAPDSDGTKALRVMTRARADLVRARVALANQLRARLEAFRGGAAALFSEIDSPISLAFLERYPTPADARALGEKRLASFLRRNAYRGRKEAGELLGRLRRAPRATATGEAETEARRGVVLAMVQSLGALAGQIALADRRISEAVRSHPDGEVFLSLFGGSTLTAATLPSEIGDRRESYPSCEALAADAGMSPVARESGRKKVAAFRRACDKRLRDAFATLADATRHRNPWAKDIYRRARDRGCEHPHAIRILGRAWTRVLWRMWRDGVPYDPDKHGALQLLKSERC